MTLSLGKLLEQLVELLTDSQKLGSQCDLTLRTGLRRTALLMPPELTHSLARAGNRVAFVVQELANEHGKLDVPPAVLAMRAASLLRTQRGKLGFPVAEGMRLDTDDVCDLSDFEEQLVG